mmetsp:Transcript_2939/g.6116  ORF Transcript_2939/g.6116 Transcript_2939/m.6116 type:complete len:193 (-) Transcript_2939:243-821(-)|eukprot:CAMPEP_0194307564 /NCGR_PEP_ID=MMETSP0171-20130528/4456_1 /TAXON_ID=218684 /ORGANISM="Corethron pennatum, Strain L29A3" /LENGTH=192 /DNA_ID=CAMNT_0039059699 /DNA_START=94 /DNA_END=672 /DNA_ORIENTATION=-
MMLYQQHHQYGTPPWLIIDDEEAENDSLPVAPRGPLYSPPSQSISPTSTSISASISKKGKNRAHRADGRALAPLRFLVGDTVECSRGYFQRGTVLAQWDEGNAYRVEIHDSYRTNVWAPFDDDHFIRAPRPRPTLRFAVGETVEAYVGSYKIGRILRHWDEGHAYRIEIQDAERNNVWADEDIDDYVRATRK